MPLMNRIRRMLARTLVDAPLPAGDGERTGSQTASGGSGQSGGKRSRGDLARYRQMRRNPTIALARAASLAPIRLHKWAYTGPDAPDDMIAFVRGVMEPMESGIVKNALYAVDYGFKPFEKVWARDDNGRLVYERIKPLSIEKSELRLDANGFAGIKQEDVILTPEYAWWFTHDQEDDDYFGQSRHENIRPEWEAWCQLRSKTLRYADLAAGAKPIVEHPGGMSRDRNGAERPDYQIAEGVVNDLSAGKGVYMPNSLAQYAKDLLNRGVDVSKFKAWNISFLEPKNTHGDEFIAMMRHFESLMLRGWLCPERTVTEGQYGTKAESEAQADVAMQAAQELLNELIDGVNTGLVQPLLVYNFGPEFRNAVRVEASPLQDQKRAVLEKIMAALLASPDTARLWLDVDAAMDYLGLPKVQAVIDNTEQDDADGDNPEEVADAILRYGDARGAA